MEQQPWHRLFGLSWADFFRGHPVTVEMEKDLSLKKQLLDVILIRKEAATLDCRLPDGFEDLARFNLITFKSHKEKLSGWSLQELIGHYVNLRKQESPSMDEDDLLAEDEFRLFAVTARYPQQLATTPHVGLNPIKDGVYEVQALGRGIRVVVLDQLAQQEHNAMLHLFSARDELLIYGAQHYQIRSPETSTLLMRLFLRFQEEIKAMPDALEEFTRETIDWLLKTLPVEKRLEGLPAEELRKRLSTEERLEGLSPEERVKGLSRKTLEELLRRMKDNGGAANPP
jgi:hypothetical protein